ncbi:MAG: hypothetical protein WD431_23540 [Cyclobacteriaceae bacterium]
MKSSLPEADRHDASITRRDDYQTPACQQTGARFPRIPIIIGTGQAIPTFGTGQVVPIKNQL